MKLENTLHNRAKFIALYCGQDILRGGSANLYEFPHSECIQYTYTIGKSSYLELTPLSHLSDEDAIELIKMQFDSLPDGFIVIKFDRSFKDIPSFTYSFLDKRYGSGVSEISLLHGSKDFNKLSVKQTMFAIRKGYYVGDGIEIEYGWVKLKEE